MLTMTWAGATTTVVSFYKESEDAAVIVLNVLEYDKDWRTFSIRVRGDLSGIGRKVLSLLSLELGPCMAPIRINVAVFP